MEEEEDKQSYQGTGIFQCEVPDQGYESENSISSNTFTSSKYSLSEPPHPQGQDSAMNFPAGLISPPQPRLNLQNYPEQKLIGVTQKWEHNLNKDELADNRSHHSMDIESLS